MSKRWRPIRSRTSSLNIWSERHTGEPQKRSAVGSELAACERIEPSFPGYMLQRIRVGPLDRLASLKTVSSTSTINLYKLIGSGAAQIVAQPLYFVLWSDEAILPSRDVIPEQHCPSLTNCVPPPSPNQINGASD